MVEGNYQSILDASNPQLNNMLDVCKELNRQLLTSSSIPIDDKYFTEHAFFNEHFPIQFGEVLEFWHIDGSLDGNQVEIFEVCSELMFNLTQNSESASEWLNKQTDLINITKECAHDIAAYGYYIDIGGSFDPSLGSFDRLVQAFANAHCQQLLDIITSCICSRFYGLAMYRLSDVNASVLTITQRFLLITCPDYVLAYDDDKSYIQAILKRMLNQYAEIFAYFIPHIENWTNVVVLCLLYPIRIILAGVRTLPVTQKHDIQQAALTILLKEPTTGSGIEQGRITLVYTSLQLLLELVRSEPNLLTELKNQTDEDKNLLGVLKQLSQDQRNEKVQLYAFELVSLLVPEEEFAKHNDSAEVTGLFVKNFNEALEDGKDEKAGELLRGLKDLVQNDEVKQQVVEQNGLPSIMKFTQETTNDPAPFEIVYALTFNADAKKAFNDDQTFVDHVKEMKASETTAISKAAHGIIWKLEGEDKFKKVIDEKKETKLDEGSKTDQTTKTSEGDKSKYDMMISYCWAQKTLCHKVNDRLEKDNFKVWLDRDEMHGSIIERMAEAIEQSRFVLICMSSNYKKSANCQAEAEYAYNRKNKIVPLVVEEKYKADGWLGFMAGSKIYVDFAGKEEDDEEFEKAYELLIAELERNGLRDVPEEEKVTVEVKPEPIVEEVIEPPPIQTREYLNAGPVTEWAEEHVQEFLLDHHLDALVPVCKSMDGETLFEFHQACQATPSAMYSVVNNPKEEHAVPLNLFFKFITKLKRFLPAKEPRKIDFRYNFIYPPSETDK